MALVRFGNFFQLPHSYATVVNAIRALGELMKRILKIVLELFSRWDKPVNTFMHSMEMDR